MMMLQQYHHQLPICQLEGGGEVGASRNERTSMSSHSRLRRHSSCSTARNRLTFCCCLLATSALTCVDGWGSFFSSSSKSSSSTTIRPELLERAAEVRKTFSGKYAVMPPSATNDYGYNEFFYPSSYIKQERNEKLKLDDKLDSEKGDCLRGFCNWLIPNHIMIGQYPGQTPEKDGPIDTEVQQHFHKMVNDVKITTFVSLQDEIPCQTNYEEWEENEGGIYLDSYYRKQFPYPFTHYASTVTELNPMVTFVHSPIIDLSVPNSESLQNLLLKLLDLLLAKDASCLPCLYIHCWGGRGRAGLIGSCLLSLIYPDMLKDPKQVLDIVQAGYDSRLGSAQMPKGLSKSPQTIEQRNLVSTFVAQVQKQYDGR